MPRKKNESPSADFTGSEPSDHWPPTNARIGANIHAALADGSWAAYEARWTIQLREQLKQTFDRKYVRLACSGTIATELALRGLRVGPGDEVILAAYDFPGNFRAVEAVGATPVLVDVEAGGWTLDPSQLSLAGSDKTRAVIASHLHGQLADLPTIAAWCQANDAALVEDACQAPGAIVAGRPAGSWGDVSTFSFGGSKLLTAGRGGAVGCNDESLYQRTAIYADRGNDAFPLSQLQAAVLLPQLDSLMELTERRAAGAQLLRNRIEGTSFIQLPPPRPDDWLPAYYKFGFRIGECDEKQRDRYVMRCAEAGLPIGAGFRGFFRRSRRRCRKVGELRHARVAAATTVLLHHPVLLADAIAIEEVANHLTENRFS